MDEYAKFLERKAVRAKSCGLAIIPPLAKHLFPFQHHCVEFALRTGCSGLFLDTGLGKTECELEWCQKAIEATNAKALILTPLAVAGQTKRRADRWGYEACVIREQSQARPGINICNYDRLDKLDPSEFGTIALDEASILKSFTGKVSNALINAFNGAHFKLAATATPAPNDHMELGQYCEFLDVMASNEMLMRWFISDQTEMGRYRLKGHARIPFFDWMVSWSRMGERPSDITGNSGDDEAFKLPAFRVIRHRAHYSNIAHDMSDIFGIPRMSATGLHDVKRQTITARAEAMHEAISSEPNETWLIWCDTNYEADALMAEMPWAVEIRGSQSIDEKEEKIEGFATGKIGTLISKPSVTGLGMDWSHCARMAFVGRNYSYETWYQAIRRCWRFGQKRRLDVHLIVAEGEDEIGTVIDRKADDHGKMKEAMRAAMARANGSTSAVKKPYEPTYIGELPSWLTSIA